LTDMPDTPPMPGFETLLAKLRRLKTSEIIVLVIGVLLIPVMVAALARYYPAGVDWRQSFWPLPAHWRDPYAEGATITGLSNPPWILLLLPHALLSLPLSNAINLYLSIAVGILVIYKYRGGWQALVLTFTSPMFFDLARTNNIDWIPLAAFLLPPMWGTPLLLIKPQVVGGALLIWWKKQKFSPLMFAPLAVVLVLSFIIWGFWPLRVAGLPPNAQVWNFAPWPIGIPLGLYMLYRAWQKEDEILGAAATPFLVPYFAPYSLFPLMALISSKYRREAFFVYVGFWAYLIIESRRIDMYINY
jgi:hypothetical protein